MNIPLPLATRSTRSVALQALWVALLTLSTALQATLPAALRTLSASRLVHATLRTIIPLTLIRRPRTSPLPGSALLPARLATTRPVRRSPVRPTPLAAGATLAGATLEAIVTKPGTSRFRTRTEPSRARADRLWTAVKPEVALSTKPFEPALATQLGTFDDPAQNTARTAPAATSPGSGSRYCADAVPEAVKAVEMAIAAIQRCFKRDSPSLHADQACHTLEGFLCTFHEQNGAFAAHCRRAADAVQTLSITKLASGHI